MKQALGREIAAKLGQRALFDEPLSRHTTWGVGGPAWCLCRVHTAHELIWLFEVTGRAGVACKVIGRGSNLLAADQGFKGVIAVMRGDLAGIKVAGSSITCGGGASLARAVRRCAEYGLGGLEWAVGIPCTVGGAVAGNAGAYDMDMASACQRVTLLLPGGESKDFGCFELPYGYRSRQMPEGAVVLEVRLRLEQETPGLVIGRRNEYLRRRKAAQPLAARTAGSVFKNPKDDYAGRLIEAAGLKGLMEGRAMISPKHANFIENTGGATAEQIKRLMGKASSKVLDMFGVSLEPEVECIGG